MKTAFTKFLYFLFVIFFSIHVSYAKAMMPDLQDLNLNESVVSNTIKLHNAITKNSVEDVKVILKDSNVLSFFSYHDGLTILQRSLVFGVAKNSFKIFDFLLYVLNKNGIDISKDTLILKIAILMGNLDVVKKLVQAGISLNEKYEYEVSGVVKKRNAIEYAVLNNQTQIANYFQEELEKNNEKKSKKKGC